MNFPTLLRTNGLNSEERGIYEPPKRYVMFPSLYALLDLRSFILGPLLYRKAEVLENTP